MDDHQPHTRLLIHRQIPPLKKTIFSTLCSPLSTFTSPLSILFPPHSALFFLPLHSVPPSPSVSSLSSLLSFPLPSFLSFSLLPRFHSLLCFLALQSAKTQPRNKTRWLLSLGLNRLWLEERLHWLATSSFVLWQNDPSYLLKSFEDPLVKWHFVRLETCYNWENWRWQVTKNDGSKQCGVRHSSEDLFCDDYQPDRDYFFA